MTDSGIAAGEHLASGAGGVQTVLSPLGRLAHTPVSDHVDVFEQVLAGLEAVLASVEDAGGWQPEARGGQESGR
ncbi:hypothetical protein [Microbispora bryophytorum]|uniref:Uncharacterized protein n=1 Tax=Microbispora bryophytorum TaxID=1460882 RepID=A0A8H9H3P4_9ACTN|nr:hypothetical protein [Microbispora bryophytorum]MBD3141238.1 hypothetical protein [Microbispora bryophytorum]TQS04605.1 hypothetical protein FLX07_21000 [Microbispora bryophytorum]GGO22921.1 hypothetical protein GCM10011574_51610 [Microbispora bryophytorum]